MIGGVRTPPGGPTTGGLKVGGIKDGGGKGGLAVAKEEAERGQQHLSASISHPEKDVKALSAPSSTLP